MGQISRTRTGTVETGGITIYYTVIAATEDDRARADDIESGIRHAINKTAVLPHTRVTYWHAAEHTHSENSFGRPTMRPVQMDADGYPFAGRNLDIEEGA